MGIFKFTNIVDFISGIMKVVVRDKGRITIPYEVRKRLGLDVGDELIIEVRGNSIILKLTDSVKVDDVVGLLGGLEVDLEEVENAAGRE